MSDADDPRAHSDDSTMADTPSPHAPSRAIGIFPTPILHAAAALDAAFVASLAASLAKDARLANRRSDALSHTEIVDAASRPEFARIEDAVRPRLVEFGELLFGEALLWRIKEMWCNVLEPGGFQGLHNHANSIASGVLYLTPTHDSSRTTFVRPLGQDSFVFRNAHAGSQHGPFNADKWVMPAVGAGDVVLFPSGLLHEVPINRGERRITLAFNAIPDRIDSWGYRIDFK